MSNRKQEKLNRPHPLPLPGVWTKTPVRIPDGSKHGKLGIIVNLTSNSTHRLHFKDGKMPTQIPVSELPNYTKQKPVGVNVN